MEETDDQAANMIKVAITGPESSGKTTLAKQLAVYYHGELVEEYAREYLTGLGRAYNEKDLEQISRTQLSLESSVKGNIAFYDTDIVVLKIWYAHKFGQVPEWLLQAITPGRYDLHLLTYPDIPYEEDPLRENPEKGEYFFNLFREELERYGFPYVIIDGDMDERLYKAKKAVDACINGL